MVRIARPTSSKTRQKVMNKRNDSMIKHKERAVLVFNLKYEFIQLASKLSTNNLF